VRTYGGTRTVQAAVTGALWHGSFKDTPGQLVLVRDPGSGKPYDLALYTLDTVATAAAVIERYSWRWPIEPSNATGKQILGVGQACNRLEAAVERTVPFGFQAPPRVPQGPIFGHTPRPQPPRSNRGLRLDLRRPRRITRKHEVTGNALFRRIGRAPGQAGSSRGGQAVRSQHRRSPRPAAISRPVTPH
jgi:hypothetical protein